MNCRMILIVLMFALFTVPPLFADPFDKIDLSKITYTIDEQYKSPELEGFPKDETIVMKEKDELKLTLKMNNAFRTYLETLAPDQKLLAVKSLVFKGFRSEESHGIFVYKADGRFTMHVGGTFNTKWKKITGVVMDFKNYRNWVLTNLNVDSKGKKYFVSLEDIAFNPGPPKVATVPFIFDFLIYKHSGSLPFVLTDNIDYKQPVTGFTAVYDNPEKLVTKMAGGMYLLKHPDSEDYVSAYFFGSAIVWRVIYEIMPTKGVLRRELADRVDTIISNYANYDSLMKAKNEVSVNDQGAPMIPEEVVLKPVEQTVVKGKPAGKAKTKK